MADYIRAFLSMVNLVSDVIGISSNRGLTLPDGKGATYNVSLSPIFIWQGGHVDLNVVSGPYVLMSRGREGRYWVRVALSNITVYMVYLDRSGFEANSSGNRYIGRSLRCLVSTKRQASE